MKEKFAEWWKSVAGSHRPAVVVAAVVIGLLVVFNGEVGS